MTAADWRISEYKGLRSLVAENAFIRVEIVPSRGSKLVSFRNMETGTEWAYCNREPWEPLAYGMPFDRGDRSGWDEMFPTILPCPCPDIPWNHATYPDHGEVWTLPWQYELAEGSARMTVHGVMVPYVLSKTCVLEGRELRFRYEVKNPAPYAFSYLWCAHNLLAVRPGMRLVVDSALNAVQYQYSHGGRLTHEPYGRSAYPLVNASGEAVDLSVIEENRGRHAEKFWFESKATSGAAGIRSPDGDEALVYLFSPEDVPYLAVWANYGVFGGDYTVAIEPATGYLDDVYMASVMQKVKQVEPFGTALWDFAVTTEKSHLNMP